MKKKDWIVIIVLLFVFGFALLFYHMMSGDKEEAVVYYHNEVIDRIDLSYDHVYTYQGDYGSFSLEVKNERYHAIHVDCPNHDCEKVGWVKKGSSRQIICLPNQIYVIQEE